MSWRRRRGSATPWWKNKVLLFGGHRAREFYGDTWLWDGTSWTKVADDGPSPRGAAFIATVGDEVVVYGGYDADGKGFTDTWTWDGLTWTERKVQGPSERIGAY